MLSPPPKDTEVCSSHDSLLHPGTHHEHSMSISTEPVANLSRGASFHNFADHTGSNRPLDYFDWKNGRFHSSGMPLWLKLSIKIIISLIFVLLPPVLTEFKLVPGAYPLISLELPVNPTYFVETLRGLWLLGIGSLAYHCMHAALCVIAYLTFRTGCINNVGVDDRVRQGIEQTLAIRRYFCTTSMAVAMAIFSRILYPQSCVKLEDIMDLSKQKKVDIEDLSQAFKDYLTRSPQFFIANGCLSFGIIAALFLVEKLIVKALARHYMNHSLASRIADNKFVRKVTRSLRQYVLAEAKAHGRNKSSSKHNGVIIFAYLTSENDDKVAVAKEDFYPLMDEETANRYWSLLDLDLLGCLNKNKFIDAIDAIYVERGAIDRAFLEQCQIIGKVDSVLMSFVWLLSIAILLLVMQAPLKFIITFFMATFGGMAFMFQSALKDAFNSFTFILFTHPFDHDDMVMIEENIYQVHELGLWTTTFVSSEGRLVYMANKRLLTQPIVNLRRSPVMSENVIVSVMPSCPLDKITDLESKLKAWLKENEREFVPSLMIRGFKISDRQHMTLEIPLSHRANFSDQTRKDLRTRKFVLYLREAIQELGIELSPPIHA